VLGELEGRAHAVVGGAVGSLCFQLQPKLKGTFHTTQNNTTQLNTTERNSSVAFFRRLQELLGDNWLDRHKRVSLFFCLFTIL